MGGRDRRVLRHRGRGDRAGLPPPPQHRPIRPILLAAIGLAVILWTMFATYNWIAELAAFAGLIAATVWDRRLRRGS